eukprot:5500450-Prorocentrum_lima.AAC.1
MSRNPAHCAQVVAVQSLRAKLQPVSRSKPIQTAAKSRMASVGQRATRARIQRTRQRNLHHHQPPLDAVLLRSACGRHL